MEPRPVSLREVLSTLEPWRIAKFLHTQMPIRFAERIRWIEDLPGWEDVAELQELHKGHVFAFRELRRVKRHPTLDEFSQVVKDAVEQQKKVVRLAATGMVRLRRMRGDQECGPEFVDRFLDRFLLNRIGSNLLMTQYLACAGALDRKFPPTGIIEPKCDAAQVCRWTVNEAVEVCEFHTGLTPTISVEAYSAFGEDCGVPKFSYIPSFLRYIMTELLKNSCRATTEIAMSGAELSQRPITIVVCADEHRVAIRVSDRARGIPFDVGPRIWSYLYSTTRGKGVAPSELAGYGVGLPLSRLYARYLGGSLDLVSLPGYGTDAYLMLPRLEADQLEVVPNLDSEYRYRTLGDYML